MHVLLDSWRGFYFQTGRPGLNPYKLVGLLAIAAVNAASWLVIVIPGCHVVGISPGVPFLIGLSVLIFAASFMGFAVLMAARLPDNE